MTRGRLAVLLGVEVAVGATLVMLAGSDQPPPPGFLLAAVAALGLGVLVWALVPRLLRGTDDVGLLRSARVLVVPVVAYLVALAALAATVTPRQPSRPEAGLGVLVGFVLVAGLVALAGAVVVAVVAVVADQARDSPGRALLVAVGIPVVFIALLVALITAAA